MTDKTFNLDDLLDGTLDELADVPEFKIYPPGVHRCILTGFEVDKENGIIYMNLKGKETVELPSGSEDDPISDGQETRMRYQMTNEYGQGDFKKIMAALAEHFGKKSNNALMEDGTGAEVLIATNIQVDKKDKSKKYLRIDTLVVE